MSTLWLSALPLSPWPAGWVPAQLILLRKGATKSGPMPPPPHSGTSHASETSSLRLSSHIWQSGIAPHSQAPYRMHRAALRLQTTEPYVGGSTAASPLGPADRYGLEPRRGPGLQLQGPQQQSSAMPRESSSQAPVESWSCAPARGGCVAASGGPHQHRRAGLGVCSRTIPFQPSWQTLPHTTCSGSLLITSCFRQVSCALPMGAVSCPILGLTLIGLACHPPPPGLGQP